VKEIDQGIDINIAKKGNTTVIPHLIPLKAVMKDEEDIAHVHLKSSRKKSLKLKKR
jgi:hypothetical protein